MLIGAAFSCVIAAGAVTTRVVLADNSHCLVINETAGTSFNSLQAAQDAASGGDTLWVRGVCSGATTVTKSLTITGQSIPGHGSPILDGGGQGVVVSLTAGIVVTINTLTITDGTGGIANLNGSNITLNQTTISGNAGRGMLNGRQSVFQTMAFATLNQSTISGNQGGLFNGGGIRGKLGLASVTLNDSSVTGNAAVDGAGVDNDYASEVILNGSSSISSNTASGAGGGVFNGALSHVVLNDASTISGNNGDGVFGLPFDTVRLNGASSISGNSGNGVFERSGAVVLSNSSSVSNNTGDGIYNVGTAPFGSTSVMLNDASTVSTNAGSGIENADGALSLTGDSSVTGNTGALGAGVLTRHGSLVLHDRSRVSGNHATDNGGGILDVNGHVTLEDACSINANSATVDGGGIYLDGSSSSLVLNGGTISYNDAGDDGGGVFNNGGVITPAAPANVVNNTPDDVS